MYESSGLKCTMQAQCLNTCEVEGSVDEYQDQVAGLCCRADAATLGYGYPILLAFVQ